MNGHLMGIKRFYSKRAEKPGWKWDAARGQFWSWGFDERIGGKRIREAGFSSQDQVKVVVGKLKERELLAKNGLQSLASAPLVTVQQLVEARAQAFDFDNAQHRQHYGVLKAFRDQLSPFTQVRQLTTEHLEAYVRDRLATALNLKPATLSRELNVIRAMLHAAGEYFPALNGRKPPQMPKLPERTLVLTDSRRGPGRPTKLPDEKVPEARKRYRKALEQARAARVRAAEGAIDNEVRELCRDFSDGVFNLLCEGMEPADVAREHVGKFYDLSAEQIRRRLRQGGHNSGGA
jgi:hypothetical protein